MFWQLMLTVRYDIRWDCRLEHVPSSCNCLDFITAWCLGSWSKCSKSHKIETLSPFKFWPWKSHRIACTIVTNPLRLNGKKHNYQLLIEEMSKSHFRKNMWYGKKCYSQLWKNNLSQSSLWQHWTFFPHAKYSDSPPPNLSSFEKSLTTRSYFSK